MSSSGSKALWRRALANISLFVFILPPMLGLSGVVLGVALLAETRDPDFVYSVLFHNHQFPGHVLSVGMSLAVGGYFGLYYVGGPLWVWFVTHFGLASASEVSRYSKLRR